MGEIIQTGIICLVILVALSGLGALFYHLFADEDTDA